MSSRQAMRRIIFLSAMVLSGCASQPPITELDTDSLCVITVTDPERKAAAEAELGSREASCNWQKVALIIEARQAERARQAAVLNAYFQMQQQNNQATYQNQIQALGLNNQRLQTNCTTTYIGNQAHTTCR